MLDYGANISHWTPGHQERLCMAAHGRPQGYGRWIEGTMLFPFAQGKLKQPKNKTSAVGIKRMLTSYTST